MHFVVVSAWSPDCFQIRMPVGMIPSFASQTGSLSYDIASR